MTNEQLQDKLYHFITREIVGAYRADRARFANYTWYVSLHESFDGLLPKGEVMHEHYFLWRNLAVSYRKTHGLISV